MDYREIVRKPPRTRIFIGCFLLAFSLFLCACNAEKNALNGKIPLVPIKYVALGGVVPWRAPLHIRDSQLQMAEFDADGVRAMRSYDEDVFPTDVLIVYSETTGNVDVFLRRSPHGGCLLIWDSEKSMIHDPCFGSQFDPTGAWISGPAGRSLDKLPFSVRDGIVWVGPDVIYGEPNP